MAALSQEETWIDDLKLDISPDQWHTFVDTQLYQLKHDLIVLPSFAWVYPSNSIERGSSMAKLLPFPELFREGSLNLVPPSWTNSFWFTLKRRYLIHDFVFSHVCLSPPPPYQTAVLTNCDMNGDPLPEGHVMRQLKELLRFEMDYSRFAICLLIGPRDHTPIFTSVQQGTYTFHGIGQDLSSWSSNDIQLFRVMKDITLEKASICRDLPYLGFSVPLPATPMPPSIVPMIQPFMKQAFQSYQMDAIEWMTDKEQSYDPLLLDASPKTPVSPRRGGVLALEMGLGKTACYLALALIDLLSRPREAFGGTLIVCPGELTTQVMQEWTDRFTVPAVEVSRPTHLWTRPGHKRSIKCADATRLKVAFVNSKVHFDSYKIEHYQEADLVIVSTSVFRQKWYYRPDMDSNRRFERMPFRRIVFDESHQLDRNIPYWESPTPLIWFVSGTPFAHDLCFETYIQLMDPNARSNYRSGCEWLHMHQKQWMRNHTRCVRKHALELPPIEHHPVWIPFQQTERLLYQTLQSDLQRQLMCSNPLHMINEEASHDVSLDQLPKMLLQQRWHQSFSSCRQWRQRIIAIHRGGLMLGKLNELAFHDPLTPEVERMCAFVVSGRPFAIPPHPLPWFAKEREEEEKESALECYIDFMSNKRLTPDQEVAQWYRPLEEVIELIDLPAQQRAVDVFDDHHPCKRFAMALVEQLDDMIADSFALHHKALEDIKSRSFLERVVNVLQDASFEEDCAVCMEPLQHVSVFPCGHWLCVDCSSKVLQHRPMCPQCRQPSKASDLVRVNLKLGQDAPDPVPDVYRRFGSKIGRLITFLESEPEEERFIVFSQFDHVLTQIHQLLSTANIDATIVRGPWATRQASIRKFQNGDVRVILLSSAYSAAGANLTKGRNVIFTDPAPGTPEERVQVEAQAIARAHRLGQTKPIRVFRFAIMDSIEEDIMRRNGFVRI